MMVRGSVSVFVAAVLAASGAACGTGPENASRDPAGQASTNLATSGTTRTTVYFLTDDGAAPIGVRRTITARSPYAREALKALLAGPTRKEEENGITTAIPEGAQLLSMTFKRHGAEEAVNLSGLPQDDTGVIQQLRITTQLTRTLIGVSGIERVWLLNEGRPWGLAPMNGGIKNGPFDYGDLVGWDVGAGCPGTETVVCDHFVALP